MGSDVLRASQGRALVCESGAGLTAVFMEPGVHWENDRQTDCLDSGSSQSCSQQ